MKKRHADGITHLMLSPGEKIFYLLLFLTATFGFALQVYNVFYSNDHTFDERVIVFVKDLHSDFFTAVMRVFTFIGSEWILVPGYLCLIVWFYVKQKNLTALHIFIISVSSLLMMMGLKLLFSRSRPLESIIGEVGGYSFPSGHSYMSFTFFGLLVYLLQHTDINVFAKGLLQLLCVCFAVMIATSRVYLGVHYFSDIVAGCCLAVMGLILTIFILNKIDFQKKNKHQ